MFDLKNCSSKSIQKSLSHQRPFLLVFSKGLTPRPFVVSSAKRGRRKVMVIAERRSSTQRAVAQPPRRPTAKSTRPQGPTPSRKVRNVRHTKLTLCFRFCRRRVRGRFGSMFDGFLAGIVFVFLALSLQCGKSSRDCSIIHGRGSLLRVFRKL